MEKLLVTVVVPVICESYDMFVPGDLDVFSLAGLIADGISSMTSGRFRKSGRELLMLLKPDMLLDPNLTLSDYNLRDGSRLMMI